MTKKSIYIIGAGASGLMAAVSAAENGACVTLLEKMRAPGRKILLTGNGRCNVTNTAAGRDLIADYGKNGRFLRGAFSRFSSADTMAFFESQGVPLIIEEGTRVFPKTGRAAAILEAMTKCCAELEVELRTDCEVMSVTARDGKVVSIETVGGSIDASRVMLATGGLSYPKTGSTGDGYRMAAALGHSIIEPRPALAPLVLRGKLHNELNAVSLPEVTVALFADGKKVAETHGGILFAPFGATGPAAMSLAKAVAAYKDADALRIEVSFMEAKDRQAAERRVAELTSSKENRSISKALAGIVPRRALDALLAHAGIDAEVKTANVSKEMRARLTDVFYACAFEVAGTKPIEEAFVTAGGVAVDEIDPRTMESRIVKGLYFGGEVMDIDGRSGGFNLQAAFTTGHAAGRAMADG